MLARRRSTLASSIGKALALAISSAVLWGCGGEDAGQSDPEYLTQAGVCAYGPTVEGIDVSKWQGTVDWEAVRDDGIAFAFARAADGTSKDRTFATNWAGMEDAGIVRGAYQFFRPSQDPIKQAEV